MTISARKTQTHRVEAFISRALLSIAFALPLCSTGQATDIPRDPANIIMPGADGAPTGRLIVKYRQPDSAPGFITKSVGQFDRAKWRAKKGLLLSRDLSGTQELVTPYSRPVQTPQTRVQIRARANAQVSAQILVDAGADGNQAAEVEFVSPEYIRQPLVFPNDPLFQGNLVQGNQSYLYEGTYSAHAPGAWDITTGSETSVIAIVDTGVLNHPELQERSVPGIGYDFVSANNPDDFTNANDGDGRDSDPTDPGDHCLGQASSWHGTEVASVAGAQANDAQGIAGIDWNARLLHARALGRCGGTDADIIDAVRWSAGITVPGLPVNDNPAQVVNLSIGGTTECTLAWQDVIDQLNELNVNVVIAAGNEAMNALRSAPANCANVITVASSDMNGELDSFFTNYGLKVTVGAPGRDILLATNEGITDYVETGNTYVKESGTSLSAAIVSGTVSLMHSLNPDLTSADVRAILQHSATPFGQTGECSGYYCGAGVLNMSRALTMTRDNSYNPDRNQERDIINAQVSPLPLDVETQSSLFGYRDIRYYQIDAPTDGMLTISSSSEENLFGYLLDARYGVLALDDDSSGNRQFRVASTVTAGRYYLAVERSRNRTQDGENTFSLYANLGTDQPDPFSFDAISNAPGNSTITSNTVEISGLSATALMTISGGFYSLNGGALTSIQALVSNGDLVTLAVKTAGAGQSTAAAQLSVGAYSTTFEVTTSDEPVKIDRTVKSRGGCSLSADGTDPTLLFLLLALSIVVSRRPVKQPAR